MAVKFPLEMKNGVQVRNISELKENFDIEKIVGYFLDGKLKKWLDARWYEDESEAVSKLDESDPLLAQHICKIFCVEYEEKEINPEEIAAKNARITKLKQYTDDEDIIKNIDFVAFNQEELADLYEKGIEKIYLCEGLFKIPYSKKSLKYEYIGDVQVEGIEVESEENNLLESVLEKCEPYASEIPLELADYIGYKEYVELDNYVIWIDYQGIGPSTHEYNTKIKPFFYGKNISNMNLKEQFKIWNRESNVFSSTCSLKTGKLNPCGNKIVYEKGWSSEGIYEYDVVSEKSQLICNEERYPLCSRISVCDDKVAFWDKNINLVVFDTVEKKKIFSKKFENPIGMLPMYFCLMDNKLFYQEHDSLLQYDFNQNVEKIVFKYAYPDSFQGSFMEDLTRTGMESTIYVEKVSSYNNSLYVVYNDRFEKEVKIIKIKSDLTYEYVKGDSIPYGENRCFFEENTSFPKRPFLVIYAKQKVYVLNMKINEIKSYVENFPSSIDHIHVVGNYLYWGVYRDKPSYRVKLDEEWKPILLDPVIQPN